MGKEDILSFLVALGYDEEKIKAIITSETQRRYIERTILDIEMKLAYNQNAKENEAATLLELAYKEMIKQREENNSFAIERLRKRAGR